MCDIKCSWRAYRSLLGFVQDSCLRLRCQRLDSLGHTMCTKLVCSRRFGLRKKSSFLVFSTLSLKIQLSIDTWHVSVPRFGARELMWLARWQELRKSGGGGWVIDQSLYAPGSVFETWKIYYDMWGKVCSFFGRLLDIEISFDDCCIYSPIYVVNSQQVYIPQQIYIPLWRWWKIRAKIVFEIHDLRLHFSTSAVK